MVPAMRFQKKAQAAKLLFPSLPFQAPPPFLRSAQHHHAIQPPGN